MVEENKLTEFFKADSGKGFETLQQQDFSAPFLVILQAMSPQCDPTNDLYLPQARMGMILNTQTTHLYQQIKVVPCRYEFRNIEWKPRSTGGGFVASYSREL